jgi:hypothetical protein
VSGIVAGFTPELTGQFQYYYGGRLGDQGEMKRKCQVGFIGSRPLERAGHRDLISTAIIRARF